MNYRNKVLNYFGFSLITEASKENYIQKTISITGKMRKDIFIIFLMWLSIFSICSLIVPLALAITERKFNTIWMYIFISVILPIIIGVVIFVKNKMLFKKLEPIPQNINIYQRDLPSKLKPAHVRMLLTDGLIDCTTIAATLLDLIDNGYIEYTKKCNYLDIFKNERIILKKTSKNQDNLLKYEKFLINWFFNIYGNGKEVSNEDIKKSLSNKQSCELFEEFQALVMISFPLDRYYNKNNINEKMNLVYKISMFISFFLLPFSLGALLCSWAMGNLLFATPRYSLNQNGVDEKDSWIDLKKFLLDFSTIQEKTIDMVAIWEYYLTYSIVLNIDSQAKYEMDNFFGVEIYKTNDQTTSSVQFGQSIKNQIQTHNLEIEKDIQQELEHYKKIM